MNELTDKYLGRKLSTDEKAEANNAIRAEIAELEDALGKLEGGSDYLLLKWGTWKEWDCKKPEVIELMKRHNELGETLSAMAQKETDEQKQILCDVIDLIDGTIQNDWDGEYYTKAEAKEYIMGYSS